MTPDAIRTITHLRQEFYRLFEALMLVPVKVINRNSYAGNSAIAYWVDSRHTLNYICLFTHTAPDELLPERPFTLRVSINQGGDGFAIARYQKSGQDLNRHWCFSLTVLPEEILDFLPWIVGLIQAHDMRKPDALPPLPHPLEQLDSTRTIDPLLRQNVCSEKASQKLSLSCIAQPG